MGCEVKKKSYKGLLEETTANIEEVIGGLQYTSSDLPVEAPVYINEKTTDVIQTGNNGSGVEKISCNDEVLTQIVEIFKPIENQLSSVSRQVNSTEEYIKSLNLSTAADVNKLVEEIGRIKQNQSESFVNIGDIKQEVDKINKQIAYAPTKQTIYDLWDAREGLHDMWNKPDGLHDLKKEIVNSTKRINNSSEKVKDAVLSDLTRKTDELKGETDRLINNSGDYVKQSVISDLTQKINRVKEVVGNTVKSSVTDSIDSAVSSGVEKGINQSLKSSDIANIVTSSVRSTVVSEIRDLKKDIIGNSIRNSKRGSFISFTIIYALIILISGVFATIGYAAGLKNLALLGHTLWNVFVSLILLVGFNIAYSIIDSNSSLTSYGEKAYRITFYVVMGLWSVCVTLIPALVIIGLAA